MTDDELEDPSDSNGLENLSGSTTNAAGRAQQQKRRFTADTEITLSGELELDDVFVESMAETDVLDIEIDGDLVTSCKIDPRVLRSAFFLYASMERTRHDWR